MGTAQVLNLEHCGKGLYTFWRRYCPSLDACCAIVRARRHALVEARLNRQAESLLLVKTLLLLLLLLRLVAVVVAVAVVVIVIVVAAVAAACAAASSFCWCCCLVFVVLVRVVMFLAPLHPERRSSARARAQAACRCACELSVLDGRSLGAVGSEPVFRSAGTAASQAKLAVLKDLIDRTHVLQPPKKDNDSNRKVLVATLRTVRKKWCIVQDCLPEVVPARQTWVRREFQAEWQQEVCFARTRLADPTIA